MASLRHIHQYMTARRQVLLDDGRIGKIVRVDTSFPANSTTVSIWTDSEKGPSISKVTLDAVVGLAPIKAAG